MSDATPHAGSAPWVHEFHSLGLEPAVLAPTDAGYFIEQATRATGLDDFGPEGFEGPLQLVLDSIARSKMSLLGRMVKLEEVHRYLTRRLMIEDELKRTPAILDETIETPIFIVSLPRAGSSILFELMSQRHGIRHPLFWEGVEPCPPPHPDTYDTDPRIASTEDWIESWNRIAPEFPSRHLVGPTVPVECLTVMGYSFASAQFVYGINPGHYHPKLTHDDWVRSYAYYARVLKLLQFNFPDKQWLFKSPAHLYNLPQLLTVFPDARIVFIHRDPLTTVASTASVMTTTHRDVFGDPFDPATYLKEHYMDGVGFLLEYMMGIYDEAVDQGGAIVNVLYRDLMDDPVAEVHRIYDEIGIGMTDDDDAAVATYLANRPKGKYGKHSYAIPDEIDVDTFRERVTPYMDRFGVPVES